MRLMRLGWGFWSHIQVAASTSRRCFSKRPWLLLSSACVIAESLPVAMPSLFPWKPPRSWQAVFKGQPPEAAGIFFNYIPLVSVQGLQWHTSLGAQGEEKKCPGERRAWLAHFKHAVCFLPTHCLSLRASLPKCQLPNFSLIIIIF